MGAILLIAQAAAATATPLAAPADVEILVRLRAREVSIEQEGPIVLRLEAAPGIADVDVVRNQPAGATQYRNLTIDARVAAWLDLDADGAATLTAEGSTGEQPQ